MDMFPFSNIKGLPVVTLVVWLPKYFGIKLAYVHMKYASFQSERFFLISDIIEHRRSCNV